MSLRIYELVIYQNDLQQYYDPSSPRYGDHALVRFTKPLDGTEALVLVIDTMLLFFIFAIVGMLSLYQTYYVAKGITTIESFENDKIYSLQREGKIPKAHLTLMIWAFLKTFKLC